MARKKKKSDFEKLVISKLTSEVAPLSKKPKKENKPKIVTKPVEKKTELSEEDEAKQISTQFHVIERRYPPSDINYTVFSKIPKDKVITKETEVGTRVIVAKYPFFYKIYFIEYMEKGTKYFPNGGIKCYNSTFDQTQCFPYDSVALHPTKKDKYRVSLVENE